MKNIILAVFILFLTACGGVRPSLVGTDSPILNVEADVEPYIDTYLSHDSAWVKNKTTEDLNVSYHLFWYDAFGVTQVWEGQKESIFQRLHLQPRQKENISLPKPTPESVNYRLYIHQ
ncbi:hypothetical protein BKG89_02135 [Rodentibacter caecimuris]|uniref:DUF1425 domain-containing protein n=2 Tax=Rodentibacter caecimuris TaxID=1796644 RepID=A0ABX3L0C9_9PAST|nr:hypothetical protein BKG89_02135 [Rodentibacter heylii]